MMKKYVLIYILFEGTQKEERYISYMAEALSAFCDKVIYVEGNDETDLEKAVYEEWLHVPENDYCGLICVTSRLFGPFWDIGKELADFEMGKDEAMAYYAPEADMPDFFVLKREICDCSRLWRQDITKWLICNKKEIHTIREDWFRPYTLIHRGYPFLNMDCLAASDFLKFTMGEEVFRAFDWVFQKADYDENIIWETILRKYNLYDIKRALHLNWIISEVPVLPLESRKKAAVFLHLFYEESLDEAMSYIKAIPSGIDTYISTCPRQVILFLKKLKDNDVPVVKVIEAGARGRDAGALLVAFRPYLLKYEYICFLHDKRSSGGLEPESVGKSFMGLMWDSLLKNERCINGVIKLFEENRNLGFLSPPLPIMGMYLKTILGSEWTVCFEETQKLAHRLGIQINIDADKPVFALSTSFWCRTQALKPLFTYSWKYEDFPKEPLKLDGTINHAIERILIYIAQERGFYSATITTEERASNYMENQQYLLDKLFGELHRGDLLELDFPLKLGDKIEDLCQLAVFCKKHKRVFLYGAGAQAKILLNRLDKLQIKIFGIAVTHKRNQESLENYPIKEFSEIKTDFDDECGIILAMSRKYQEEVIETVAETGVDYFCIKAED